MIYDSITGKQYEAKKCRMCGNEEIYVLHTVNPLFPDDIDKDDVFCRCEKCKYIPKGSKWDGLTNCFNNVQEAVDFWNEKN